MLRWLFFLQDFLALTGALFRVDRRATGCILLKTPRLHKRGRRHSTSTSTDVRRCDRISAGFYYGYLGGWR